MKDRVWPYFQKQRRELKIRCAVKYFWRNLRYLVFGQTLSFVFDMLKLKKQRIKLVQNMLIKIRDPSTVTSSSLCKLLTCCEFEKVKHREYWSSLNFKMRFGKVFLWKAKLKAASVSWQALFSPISHYWQISEQL